MWTALLFVAASLSCFALMSQAQTASDNRLTLYGAASMVSFCCAASLLTAGLVLYHWVPNVGAIGVVVLFMCGVGFFSRSRSTHGHRASRHRVMGATCFGYSAELLVIGLYLYG